MQSNFFRVPFALVIGAQHIMGSALRARSGKIKKIINESEQVLLQGFAQQPIAAGAPGESDHILLHGFAPPLITPCPSWVGLKDPHVESFCVRRQYGSKVHDYPPLDCDSDVYSIRSAGPAALFIEKMHEATSDVLIKEYRQERMKTNMRYMSLLSAAMVRAQLTFTGHRIPESYAPIEDLDRKFDAEAWEIITEVCGRDRVPADFEKRLLQLGK